MNNTDNSYTPTEDIVRTGIANFEADIGDKVALTLVAYKDGLIMLEAHIVSNGKFLTSVRYDKENIYCTELALYSSIGSMSWMLHMIEVGSVKLFSNTLATVAA